MYYSDKAISEVQEDLLNRSGFARILAETLINIKNEETFTLGVYGKWGSGKTSVVNMALEMLEEKHDNKTIVVHFEPWNFSGVDQLLSQFFIRMANEIRDKKGKQSAEIGQKLEEYANVFSLTEGIPYVGKIVSLFGTSGMKKAGEKLIGGFDVKDIHKMKESIITTLSNQENRYLIVIDDIDRLSSEQIRCVFQLVNSVAKFPKTTYLLVFDKEIVIRALSKVQEGSGEEYLEKIIQMPIQLPDIRAEELHKALFSRLDEIMAEYKAPFTQKRWQQLYEKCVYPFISSFREINRLCNSLKFKLTTISSEIEFSDLIAISILEINCPAIYQWIKENKQFLTGGFSWDNIFINKSQKDLYEEYKKRLDKIAVNSSSAIERELSGEGALEILARLFPVFGQKIGKIYDAINDDYYRKANLVAHVDKFDRYFQFTIDDIGVTKFDADAAINSKTVEDLKLTFNKYEEKNLGFEFVKEIQARLEEVDSNQAKILFDGFIYISTISESGNNKGIFYVSAKSLAEHLLLDILEKIDIVERSTFIIDKIKTATDEDFSCISSMLNMIELGYGRLAAEGEERNYKKVVDINDLEAIEKVWTQKIKEIIEKKNLFELVDWRLLFYMLENYDSEYVDKYMKDALKCLKNRLLFLVDSVNVWTGTEVEYEINNRYEKYMTKEETLDAVNKLLENKELFDMPELAKKAAIAFWLSENGEDKSWSNRISDEAVKNKENEWRLGSGKI